MGKIHKLLIANRGEIACRVIHTARQMQIPTVAVYSQADANARHVAMADEAVAIGPPPAAESYLRPDRIIDACHQTGANAVHPGYGFLSENADFADALAAAGIIFVGPSSSSIRAMGLKDAAKRLMIEAGVPVVPGYQGEDQAPETLAAEAGRIGYPVLIKAVAGGGGKGMRRVDEPADLPSALAGAKREAANSFGDDRVLIEKFLTTPRHIEIQVFGDTHGSVVHLFERDCSLQRRHQKVIEEAPAPGMSEAMRAAMGEAAVKAAKAIDYVGAGTIEFIADVSEGLQADRFYFMEMNTRLQVEHPVTEAITGQDLVEWQLRVAQGEPLPKSQDELAISGHAIEARLYAEDPDSGFLPSTGRLSFLAGYVDDYATPFTHGRGSDRIRLDTGVVRGSVVTPFYDPMIAKLIAHEPNRESAVTALSEALRCSLVEGCKTNRSFLVKCLEHPDFGAGLIDTGFIDRHGDSLLGPIQEVTSPGHLADMALSLLPAWQQRKRPKEGSTSPWTSQAGFTQFGTLSYPVAAEVNGQRLSGLLRCQRTGDRAITVTLAVPGLGEGTAAWAPNQWGSYEGTANGEPSYNVRDYVLEDGRLFFELTDRLFLLRDNIVGEMDHDELAAEPVITADLPGVVRDVLVKPGDAVEKDQPLIIVEAMKMEHTLRAPRAGTVESVGAEAGALVSEGTVLIRLAEEEQEAPVTP